MLKGFYIWWNFYFGVEDICHSVLEKLHSKLSANNFISIYFSSILHKQWQSTFFKTISIFHQAALSIKLIQLPNGDYSRNHGNRSMSLSRSYSALRKTKHANDFPFRIQFSVLLDTNFVNSVQSEKTSDKKWHFALLKNINYGSKRLQSRESYTFISI